eukprot:gene36765-biopygen25947
MLNSGGIINCDITSSDLLRAEEIYGPPIASLKGKTVKNTATPNKDKEPVIGNTFPSQHPYPVEEMFAAKLKSKTTQSIFAALTGRISDISARGFKPSKLRFDPEAGFTAMKDTLSVENGVTVDAVGAGEHVRIVEPGIRMIKERVRGIVNTLPFKLCSMLLVLLVLFCVSRINMLPSMADSIVISPWERFHKRKLDYSKNLKAGFGEYCQAHDNEGDNTLKPRTTGAITVYDTGARDGTWYLFNLNLRKLIKRKKFTIIPMPDVVINFLNNLHDIDEAGDESDINFQIGREDKREIYGAPEEMNEDEAYQDYIDQVAKRFIT